MASGFLSGGVDLDAIFAPYTTGTHPATTGFEVGGVDINTRYAPISQGSAALVTGYKISGGADLNTLFAAASSTTVTVGTQPANVSGSTSAGDPSGTVTSNTTTCAGAGGTGSYSYTWHIASGSGVTFTAGTSATTGVTGTVNANTTLSGTMYCTISDGISSVNTNTVNWSLQNTTIPVSVGVQPSNVSGSAAAGSPSGTVTSGSTSCSGANGTGSYSYEWVLASGSGMSFTAPNSASTAVTGTVNANTTITGTMYCKITDSTGGTVNTSTVTWSLDNTSPAIQVITGTIGGSATYPQAASAGVYFTSDGTQWEQSNQTDGGGGAGTAESMGSWDPEGDGGNYQIMATLVSGPAPDWTGYNNTLNVWGTPTSGLGTPSWGISVTNSGGQSEQTVLNIQIRRTSTGVVVASNHVTLSVTDRAAPT